MRTASSASTEHSGTTRKNNASSSGIPPGSRMSRVRTVDVDVSSGSHPVWTGRGRVVDTEGRVQAWVVGSGGDADAEQALADALADGRVAGAGGTSDGN